MSRWLKIAVLRILFFWAAAIHSRPAHAQNQRRPNIVVVLTDDQDLLLNSTHPRYMPNLHSYMRLRGMELEHFVTSIASCCPSRTSLLTGRYCHNTNVTSNAYPRGGYVKFMENDLDRDYLPVWLQRAGYDTYLIGKLLNGFTEASVSAGCPRGWSVLDAQVIGDTGANEELYYQDMPLFLTNNCSVKETYPNMFTEVVLREKMIKYIDQAAANANKPFFMLVSTTAPHDGYWDKAAVPEVEHKYRDLYSDVQLIKSPNFARPVPKQIGYWWEAGVTTQLDVILGRYRARLQSMRSVDDTVGALYRRLACTGLLANTIVIYTSDNGFKLGNHNIAQEKFTQYEEDVRLPFFMTGPGVPRGVRVGNELQASMTDLTATLMWLAGANSTGEPLDGAALPMADLQALYRAPNQEGYTPPRPDSTLCAPEPPPEPLAPGATAAPSPPPLPPPRPSLTSSPNPATRAPSPSPRPPNPSPRAHPPSPRPASAPVPRPSNTTAAPPSPSARTPPRPPSPRAVRQRPPSPPRPPPRPRSPRPPRPPPRPRAPPQRPRRSAVLVSGVHEQPELQRSGVWKSLVPHKEEADLQGQQQGGRSLLEFEGQSWALEEETPILGWGERVAASGIEVLSHVVISRVAPLTVGVAEDGLGSGLVAGAGSAEGWLHGGRSTAQVAGGDEVEGGGGSGILELLGEWRPEGWSWQHDTWIEEHADGLGLTHYIEQARRAAAAEAEAAGGDSDSEGSDGDGDGGHEAHGKLRRILQEAVAAVAGDGRALHRLSLRRARRAAEIALPKILARRAAEAAEAAEGGEGSGQRRRRMQAGQSEEGPVPTTRFATWTNIQLIESWLDGIFKNKDYRTLRVCTPYQGLGGPAGVQTCYKYTVLCNPVAKQTPIRTVYELYDLGQDPYEIRDRSRSLSDLRPFWDRLDALLTVMAYCKGATCRNPFLRIHPSGRVTNFQQAMDPQYDTLYGRFQKLQYNRCAMYWSAENEFPDPYLAGYSETMP